MTGVVSSINMFFVPPTVGPASPPRRRVDDKGGFSFPWSDSASKNKPQSSPAAQRGDVPLLTPREQLLGKVELPRSDVAGAFFLSRPPIILCCAQHNDTSATPASVERCIHELQAYFSPPSSANSTMETESSPPSCGGGDATDRSSVNSTPLAASSASSPTANNNNNNNTAAPYSSLSLQFAKVQSVEYTDESTLLYVYIYSVEQEYSKPDALEMMLKRWLSKREGHENYLIILHHQGFAKAAAGAGGVEAPRMNKAVAQLKRYTNVMESLKVPSRNYCTYHPSITPTILADLLKPACRQRALLLENRLNAYWASKRGRALPSRSLSVGPPAYSLNTPNTSFPSASAAPTTHDRGARVQEPGSTAREVLTGLFTSVASTPARGHHSATSSFDASPDIRRGGNAVPSTSNEPWSIRHLWRLGYAYCMHCLQCGWVDAARLMFSKLFAEYYNNSDDHDYINHPNTVRQLCAVPNLFSARGQGGHAPNRNGHVPVLGDDSDLMEGLLYFAAADISASLLLGDMPLAKKRYEQFMRVTREKFDEVASSSSSSAAATLIPLVDRHTFLFHSHICAIRVFWSFYDARIRAHEDERSSARASVRFGAPLAYQLTFNLSPLGMLCAGTPESLTDCLHSLRLLGESSELLQPSATSRWRTSTTTASSSSFTSISHCCDEIANLVLRCRESFGSLASLCGFEGFAEEGCAAEMKLAEMPAMPPFANVDAARLFWRQLTAIAAMALRGSAQHRREFTLLTSLAVTYLSDDPLQSVRLVLHRLLPFIHAQPWPQVRGFVHRLLIEAVDLCLAGGTSEADSPMELMDNTTNNNDGADFTSAENNLVLHELCYTRYKESILALLQSVDDEVIDVCWHLSEEEAGRLRPVFGVPGEVLYAKRTPTDYWRSMVAMDAAALSSVLGGTPAYYPLEKLVQNISLHVRCLNGEDEEEEEEDATRSREDKLLQMEVGDRVEVCLRCTSPVNPIADATNAQVEMILESRNNWEDGDECIHVVSILTPSHVGYDASSRTFAVSFSWTACHPGLYRLRSFELRDGASWWLYYPPNCCEDDGDDDDDDDDDDEPKLDETCKRRQHPSSLLHTRLHVGSSYCGCSTLLPLFFIPEPESHVQLRVEPPTEEHCFADAPTMLRVHVRIGQPLGAAHLLSVGASPMVAHNDFASAGSPLATQDVVCEYEGGTASIIPAGRRSTAARRGSLGTVVPPLTTEASGSVARFGGEDDDAALALVQIATAPIRSATTKTNAALSALPRRRRVCQLCLASLPIAAVVHRASVLDDVEQLPSQLGRCGHRRRREAKPRRGAHSSVTVDFSPASAVADRAASISSLAARLSTAVNATLADPLRRSLEELDRPRQGSGSEFSNSLIGAPNTSAAAVEPVHPSRFVSRLNLVCAGDRFVPADDGTESVQMRVMVEAPQQDHGCSSACGVAKTTIPVEERAIFANLRPPTCTGSDGDALYAPSGGPLMEMHGSIALQPRRECRFALSLTDAAQDEPVASEETTAAVQHLGLLLPLLPLYLSSVARPNELCRSASSITFCFPRGAAVCRSVANIHLPFYQAFSTDYHFTSVEGRYYCHVSLRNELQRTSLWVRGVRLLVLDAMPTYEVVRVSDNYEAALRTEMKCGDVLQLMFELAMCPGYRPCASVCEHRVQAQVMYSDWVRTYLTTPEEYRMVLLPTELPPTEVEADAVYLDESSSSSTDAQGTSPIASRYSSHSSDDGSSHSLPNTGSYAGSDEGSSQLYPALRYNPVVAQVLAAQTNTFAAQEGIFQAKHLCLFTAIINAESPWRSLAPTTHGVLPSSSSASSSYIFVAGEPVRFVVRLQPHSEAWPEDADVSEDFFVQLLCDPDQWMMMGKQSERRTLSVSEEVVVFFTAVPLLSSTGVGVPSRPDNSRGESSPVATPVVLASQRTAQQKTLPEEMILPTPSVALFWATGADATDRGASCSRSLKTTSITTRTKMSEVLVDVVPFREAVRVRKP